MGKIKISSTRDLEHLRKRMRGEDVVVVFCRFGILRFRAVTVEEDVAKNYASRFLYGLRQNDIVVTRAFNRLDLVDDILGRLRTQLFFELLQSFNRRILLRRGEIHVKRNDLGTALTDFVDHLRITTARDRPGTYTLQCFFINIHDDDAFIMRTRTTHPETRVERT